MANFFEEKKRRVIPNWRSYKLTVEFGELDNISSNPREHNLSIDDYIFDWQKDKTISKAGDLISSAFVNGFPENPVVKEAAIFILNNEAKSTFSLSELAKEIIEQKTISPSKNLNFNNIDEYIKSNHTGNLIRAIKIKLNKFPYNPILYVELSRLYSFIGKQDKSITNMHIALQMSPNNRFILRAASRLFAHFGMVDYIHDIIRKSDLVKFDPWITSTEIALATIRERNSKFIKTGLELINSNNFSPLNITELATSIATLEFYYGSIKNTRKLLNRAIISPNDNTIAQIEWLMHIDNILTFNPTDYKIINNFEAIALENFYKSNWDLALENSAYWLCDLPFSKRPILLGSHIAGSILDKQKTAREFLRAGLKSHPNDPQLINNLTYSLALENRIPEAEKLLHKINNLPNINDSTKICLTATRGLINFRKGNYDAGRKDYIKAMEDSKSLNNDYYNWLAILNFAREELLIKSEFSDSIMNAVSLVPDKTKHIEINKLKKQVIELKNK